jgi:zinc transporter ZupT
VPEWEPVGTAVFVPLAASERLKKRVIGWKFLQGTSPVASVPGYSLR